MTKLIWIIGILVTVHAGASSAIPDLRSALYRSYERIIRAQRGAIPPPRRREVLALLREGKLSELRGFDEFQLAESMRVIALGEAKLAPTERELFEKEKLALLQGEEEFLARGQEVEKEVDRKQRGLVRFDRKTVLDQSDIKTFAIDPLDRTRFLIGTSDSDDVASVLTRVSGKAAPVREAKLGKMEPQSLAISPDGKWEAWAILKFEYGKSYHVDLIDHASGDEVQYFVGYSNIQFLKNGRVLLMQYKGPEATRKLLLGSIGPGGKLEALKEIPMGSGDIPLFESGNGRELGRAVTQGLDSNQAWIEPTIEFYSADSGQLLRKLVIQSKRFLSYSLLAGSSDASRIAYVTRGRLELIDGTTGKVISVAPKVPDGEPKFISFTPAGDRLVYCAEDSAVWIYDISDDQLRPVGAKPNGQVKTRNLKYSLSSDGKKLYAATPTGIVEYDLESTR